MNGWEVRGDCGICRGDLNGSECKKVIDNDHPLLTPQDLCILALSDVLENNRLNGEDKYMQHAWTCLDLALSSDAPVYSRNNQNLLNQAFATANNLLRNHHEHNINEVLEAISFKNYESLFRAMTQKEPVTPELIFETRQNVGALIMTIDDNPDFPIAWDGPIRGFMAEQSVQWLSLHNALLYENPEYIIYPTSHREGHNWTQKKKRFNHDGYQITECGRVRIETKRGRNSRRGRRSYDRSIAYVTLQDILDETKSRVGKVGSKRDNFLIGAIRDASNGRRTPVKEKVLQVAGAVMQKTINNQNALVN
jgi:hypothetical protein